MNDYKKIAQKLDEAWKQDNSDRAFAQSMKPPILKLESVVMVLQEDCEMLESELDGVRSRFFLCVALAAIAGFAAGALMF